MSDDNKTLTPDEVKDTVVEELGLDYEDEGNKAIVDKVVEARIEAQTKLSKAIDQKVGYRTKAVDAGLLDPKTFEPIKKEVEPNKPNETQSSLSREEVILIAKGHTEEEVELANKLSKINGTSLLEAVEDDIFKAKVDTRVKSEQDKTASLGASKGAKGGKAPKPYKEMTEEERIAQFNETMGN